MSALISDTLVMHSINSSFVVKGIVTHSVIVCIIGVYVCSLPYDTMASWCRGPDLHAKMYHFYIFLCLKFNGLLWCPHCVLFEVYCTKVQF